MGVAGARAFSMGDFCSFLDGFLWGDGSQGASGEAQPRPLPGLRDRRGDEAVPTSIPGLALAPSPVAAGWGFSTALVTAEGTVAPSLAAAAPGTPDLSGGPASPREPAVLPPLEAMAGPYASNASLLQDTPAAPAHPDGGPLSAAEGMSATGELAFLARLRPPEPVSGAAAGAVPPASAAAPANPVSVPRDGSRTVEPSAQPGAWLDQASQESQNTAIPEDRQDVSNTRQPQRTSPASRDAGPFTGLAAKGGAPSGQHSAGGRGENSSAASVDAEAYNAAVPPPADREARAAVPAPQSTARPGAAEPPEPAAEPAAQPASRGVSLRLAEGPSRVDIRMAERAGEIRVTVHTPDHDLANSLRADLPGLVGKLRQSGFQAEAWRPAAAAQPDAGRRGGAGDSPSQEHPPGARKDGRQRQPQPEHPKNQSRWAGEWESRLGPAQESQP